MFAARSLVKNSPQLRLAIQQARNMTVVSGPPSQRMSIAEKAAHGIIITIACMAVPAWVLVHIREYRGLEK